jgi:hypothetical protein
MTLKRCENLKRDELLKQIDELSDILLSLPNIDQKEIKKLDDELSTFIVSVDNARSRFDSIKEDMLKRVIDEYKKRYLLLFKKVIELGEADKILAIHDENEEVKGQLYGAGPYLVAAYLVLEQAIDFIHLLEENIASVSNEIFKRLILELNQGRDCHNNIIKLEEIEYLLDQVIMARTKQYGADVLKINRNKEWKRLMAKKPPFLVGDPFAKEKQEIFNKIILFEIETNEEKMGTAEKVERLNKRKETIKEKYERIKHETLHLIRKYLVILSKEDKIAKDYSNLNDIYVKINKHIGLIQEIYEDVKNKNNSVLKKIKNKIKNDPVINLLSNDKKYIISLNNIKKKIHTNHLEIKYERMLFQTMNEIDRLKNKLNKFDQAPVDEEKIIFFKNCLDRSEVVINLTGKMNEKMKYEFAKVKKGIHKLSTEIRDENKQYVSELNKKLYRIQDKLRKQDDILAMQLEVVRHEKKRVEKGIMGLDFYNHHKELVESYLQYIDQLNFDATIYSRFRKIYEENQLNYNELQNYRQDIENLEFNLDMAQRNMDALLKMYPLLTIIISKKLTNPPEKYLEFVNLYELIRKNGNDFFAKNDCIYQLVTLFRQAFDALLQSLDSHHETDSLIDYLTFFYDINQNKLYQEYTDLFGVDTPESFRINALLNQYSTEIFIKRIAYEKKKELANKNKYEAIKKINSFRRKCDKDGEMFGHRLQSKNLVKVISNYSEVIKKLNADLARLGDIDTAYERNKNNYEELDKYYHSLALVKANIENAVDNFEAIRDLEPLITNFLKQVSFNQSKKMRQLEQLLESIIDNKDNCLLDITTVSKLREKFMLIILEHLRATDPRDLRNIPFVLSAYDQGTNSPQYEYSSLFKEYSPHLLPDFTQLLNEHKNGPYFELQNQREAFRRNVTNTMMKIETAVISVSSREARSVVDTTAAADQFTLIKQKYEEYADIYEEFIFQIQNEYKSLSLEYDQLENEITVSVDTTCIMKKMEILKIKSATLTRKIAEYAKSKDEYIECIKSKRDCLSSAKGNFDNRVMRSDIMTALIKLKCDLDQGHAQLNIYQADKKNYLKKLEQLHDYESDEWHQWKEIFVGKLHLGENSDLCDKISSDLIVVAFFADLQSNINKLINHDKYMQLLVSEYKDHPDYRELFSLLRHPNSATYTLITEYTKDFDQSIAKLQSQLNRNIEKYKSDLSDRVRDIELMASRVSDHLVQLEARWCEKDKALWSHCQDLSYRFSSSQDELDTSYECAKYFYSPQLLEDFHNQRSQKLTTESLQNLCNEASLVARKLQSKLSRSTFFYKSVYCFDDKHTQDNQSRISLRKI